ncbi:aldehyde dehydrogenase family protein [Williamsia sp. CHRR-6]|uniref:aldehyde dehydrogenase family protein n=1 Tax=Williamsia sp. CHRR-6 TaxID=2835871 RepID=UPI001BDA7F69|nr:aldehyde dehydrogenase family protein [Williamsia sp. CHRR-6]MBT0566414.1 aldehyde dehydrogenase family protein [Williamsia sp. CHRR-6]
MTTSELTRTTVEAVELKELFDRQRAAFLAEGPPSAEVRRNRLDRLALALSGASDDLVAALDADFGQRPEQFSLVVEILSVLAAIQHARDNLEDWMQPIPVAGSAESGIPTTIDVDPKGVVGVVGPWNFPVQLVVLPAAEAIAAGNRVMIKFTDVNSRSGQVLADAIARYFPPEELVVVNGGIDVATAFSALPFDHLFFTGSPAVGKIVMRSAADNLTPVTLELGGKNPVVVGTDADIAESAKRIALARMINGGQVCLCPDYVFVPTSSRDAFVEGLRATFAEYFPDYATNPNVTSIINDRNYDRVTGLIDDAVAKGATAIVGVADEKAARLPDPQTRFIAPTILLGVTDEMQVAHEEIFGPVLVVFTYDDLSEPISYITSRPSPLAAYWYGDDSAEFAEFRRKTTSGGMSRNDFAVHLSVPDVPFGGIGQSGMGSYHGKPGFDTFSHRRAVSASELPVPTAVSLHPGGYDAKTIAGLRAAIAGAHADATARIDHPTTTTPLEKKS